MKKYILLTLLISLFIILFFAHAEPRETERLPDAGKILAESRCLRKGLYEANSPNALKLKKSDTRNISGLGKPEDSLDSPEEFLTALYYSTGEVLGKPGPVFSRELPRNKTGALRLSSLWLKRCAEFPEGETSCRKAVDFIRKESNLSEREVNKFYGRSIEFEIMRHSHACMDKWYTDKALRNNIVKPIIEYYIKPSHKTEYRMIDRGASLFEENRGKGEGYLSVLRKLNEPFAARIQKRISEKIQAHSKGSPAR